MTPAAIQAFLVARTQRRRAGSPSTPTRRRATATLNRIRSHRHSIGGYAARFDIASQRAGGVREVVQRGAFAASIAAGGLYLLRDHLNAADDGAASLASMRAHTLHVVEDAYGLWFEAALDGPDGAPLFARVCRGEIVGASIGSTSGSGRMANGMRVLDTIAAWEISLVTPPNQPARVGTWCKANAEARRDRARLMRLS